MAKFTVLTQNKNYINLKQRIKYKHAKKLLNLVREVNFVFNFANNKNIQRDMNAFNNIFMR